MKTIVDEVSVHAVTEHGRIIEAWAHLPHTAEVLGLRVRETGFSLVIRFTREDGTDPTSRKARLVLLSNYDELPGPAHKLKYLGSCSLTLDGSVHVFLDLQQKD